MSADTRSWFGSPVGLDYAATRKRLKPRRNRAGAGVGYRGSGDDVARGQDVGVKNNQDFSDVIGT
jgi:hypothetical protein